ncbi:hypothetical protein ACFLYH_00945 [Candidatus Dependentiae bacterium]
MRKRLQKIFLLGAFLSIFLGNSDAAVNWNNNNTIMNGAVPGSVWDDTLNMSGTITLSEDVYIGALLQDTTVNITSNNVIVQPASDGSTANLAKSWGHLIFYADSGREITVNVDYDLIFNGAYSNVTDLIVTFSGQGVTRFKLQDYHPGSAGRGVNVSFTGNSTGAVGYPIIRGGTRVYILMDQTETQAVTNGINKVIFQRENYNHPTSGYIYTGQPTGVIVGPGSFITYLSTNPTGDPADANASGDYGSVAFDPTYGEQVNKGRLFLEIQGDSYNYNNHHDGGVIVCGHYVPTFDETSIRNAVYLNATAGRRALFRIIDDLIYAEGTKGEYDPDPTSRRGLLVINKNSTVPSLAADPYQTYNLSASSSNPDATHPVYPYYWSAYYSWYSAPNNSYASTIWPRPIATTYPNTYNTRNGFVLGTNGWMDVYPNTYLDHVACNWGELNYFATQDYASYSGSTYDAWNSGSPYFMWRNPASFVVDGLGYYNNRNNYWLAQQGVQWGDDGTMYNDSSGAYYAWDSTLYAHMVFYGDARAYFRCAADNTGVVSEYGPYSDGAVTNPTYEYLFWVDNQPYNSQYIPSNYTTVSPQQGEGVLDVEGKFGVYTKLRNDAPNRALYVVPTIPEKGTIGMPTLNLDYMGQETGYTWSTPDRPLVNGRSYYISNSPHMFCNATFEIYNSIFSHTDVTKNIATNPQVSPPAIVGGEAKWFNHRFWPSSSTDSYLFDLYEWPKQRYFSSDLNMHESLVASGVRFITKDIIKNIDGTLVWGTDANNESVFRFYDHGDKLDTIIKGYGRLFMLGCGCNQMSAALDSVYTNSVTESGFINVYRGEKAVAPNTPATSIRLGVQGVDDADSAQDLKSASLINDDEYGWNRATHLFLLSRGDHGKAFMSLGWTNTFGNDFFYPWEATNKNGTYHLAIDTNSVTPATFSVDGNYIYFGGTDWSNNKAVIPVTSATQGSVIYTNHGGRFTATQPERPAGTLYAGAFDTTQHGYDCFVDTALAYRLWGTEPLYGIIDVPKDQIVYGHGFGRQPYDINTTLSSSYFPEEGRYGLRVRTYNTSGVVTPDRADAISSSYKKYYSRDLHSGEEVVIPWGRSSHIYDTNFWPTSPAKSFVQKSVPTRYTAMIDEGPGFPDKMLYFGAGDYVTQLKVAGATMSDPINMLVSGNKGAPGYARIREFVSIPTNPEIWGEGAHALIFLNHSGRIGLGDRDWNEHSENAWSLLGKDYVTIAADGDCAVDVNSNLLVTDNGAIVATTMFGADASEYKAADEGPRLTFFSEERREIRVPRGVELDLSTFAKQLGTTKQQQIIEIGGRLRLIFEPGSTLRFPRIDTVVGDTTPRPVLYINDEAQIIFEEELEESKGRHMDIRSTDSQKTLILGHGEIWLNKDAKMIINDGAMVAVQSDPRTPTTDLKISIQRQGDFVIGTETNAGGSFEVGNPVDMDYFYTEYGYPHPINFELAINGPKSRFHIDREGFLGLGVGIVNKNSSTINGNAVAAQNPDTHGNWNPGTTGWEVQALFNVHNVTISVTRGIFDHSNIYDGNARRASLIAVGPLYPYEEIEGAAPVDGKYRFVIQDPVESRILGGGNIMRIDKKDVQYPGKAFVNVWNYADVAPRLDGTMYNILSSAQILLQNAQADFISATITQLPTAHGQGQQFLSGPYLIAPEFFEYLSGKNYLELDTKMVNVGATEFQTRIGYVNPSTTFAVGAQIYRRDNVFIIGEGFPEEGIPWGVLGAAGTTYPETLQVINRRG